MRKYLTTGLFSAILGLAVGAPTDAALVSRGFLDEVLTDYATNTALDLKANQSDLTELSDKIGTLPDVLTVANLYDGWTDSNNITYSGLNTISQDYASLLDAFGTSGLFSLFVKGGTLTVPGFPTNTILPLSELSYGVSKIGDLPTGYMPPAPGWDQLLGFMNQYYGIEATTYPTSLAGLMELLFGNNGVNGSSGYNGILQTMYLGYPPDDIGIIPNHVLAIEAKELATTANTTATAAQTTADSAVEKIGTLPTEYATVGVALTAIKGIAEDAKAAALSAIPDPKTEGSTGKYVLTVDIVGDNATYRWEKIDREGETTTTTE